MLLSELLTLQKGEQQLQALGCATKTFAGAIQALKPGSAIVATLCRPS